MIIDIYHNISILNYAPPVRSHFAGVERTERRKEMKKVILILSLLLIAVLVLACASAPSPAPPSSSAPAKPAASSAAPPVTSAAPASSAAPAASGEPIKIGALLELTGENAVNGPVQKAAIEYKLNQINSQIAGRKVQVIIEDSATDPVVGVDKAKKLVLSDKIDAMIGPLHSGVAAAVANYMKGTGIPDLLSMPQPAGLLKMGASNIFFPFGTNSANGYYLGLYAYDKLKYKSAVTVYEDFNAGQEYSGSWVNAFKKAGGQVLQETAVKSGTTDFSPYLTNLKQSDVAFFWFTPVLSQRFVAQYYAAGMKPPLVVPGCSVLIPQLLAQIGDKAVGIIGTQVYSSLLDNPQNKAYVDDFMKKYNMIPIATSIVADVSMSLYFEAVKSLNGDSTPAKTVEALKKVKTDTLAGTYSFTPNGLGIGDVYVLKVVKVPDRYDWSMIDRFSQIPLDAPAQ
jgi:branched-chain amino acid transport system substrate-binding protein